MLNFLILLVKFRLFLFFFMITNKIALNILVHVDISVLGCRSGVTEIKTIPGVTAR